MTATTQNPITVASLMELTDTKEIIVPMVFAKGSVVEGKTRHIAYTQCSTYAQAEEYMKRVFGDRQLEAVAVRFTRTAIENAHRQPDANAGLLSLLNPATDYPGFVFIGDERTIRVVRDHFNSCQQFGASHVHLAHLHIDDVDHRTRLPLARIEGVKSFDDINKLAKEVDTSAFGFPTIQELLINKHDGKQENPPVFYQNGLVGLMASTKAQVLHDMTPEWVVLCVKLDVDAIAERFGDAGVRLAAAKSLSPTGVFYIATHRDKLPMAKMFLANQVTESVLNDSTLTFDQVLEVPSGFFELAKLPTHELITGFTVHHYNSMGFVSDAVRKNALADRGNQVELQLFVEKRAGYGSLKNSTAIFAFTNGKITQPMQIDKTANIGQGGLDLETTLLNALGEIAEKAQVKVTVTVSESTEGRAKNVDTPLGILKEFQGVWSTTNARTYLDFTPKDAKQ